MINMLDILISIITILYMYLLSRQIMEGLYVGLIAQFIWVIFIIQTESWGLLPLNIALWYICITGIIKWKKE